MLTGGGTHATEGADDDMRRDGGDRRGWMHARGGAGSAGADGAAEPAASAPSRRITGVGDEGVADGGRTALRIGGGGPMHARPDGIDLRRRVGAVDGTAVRQRQIDE